MSDPNALPLYVQISEVLIREIVSGRRVLGERLPPERALAAEMGASVGTLRKALADLAEKGVIERRHGSGNYIASVPEAVGVYGFFRLEGFGGGGLPTAEVLSVARRAKPANLPAFGSEPEAHRIRRLRRVAGAPAALEEIWLDGVYADAIDPADLSPSLYLFYKDRLGLWIARAEDRIGQGPVPYWSVPAFAPPTAAPVPMVERIGWAQDGTRAEVSRTWFDPDVVRYVSRIA